MPKQKVVDLQKDDDREFQKQINNPGKRKHHKHFNINTVQSLEDALEFEDETYEDEIEEKGWH